jgi:hypothetical protein
MKERLSSFSSADVDAGDVEGGVLLGLGTARWLTCGYLLRNRNGVALLTKSFQRFVYDSAVSTVQDVMVHADEAAALLAAATVTTPATITAATSVASTIAAAVASTISISTIGPI